jgi:hypothetical protein
VIVAVAILMATACVLASTRRLWFAANPTALHPEEVVASLGRAPDRAALERLRDAVANEPAADWEQDLLAALAESRVEARVALVNEQLTELDLRMQRWARVPRVCASIATSFGIMLGTLVLRNGLAAASDLTGEIGERFVLAVLNDAMSVATFGVVGTAFCIAAHSQARRLTRARLQAVDRMIETLEAAAEDGRAPGAGEATRRELPDSHAPEEIPAESTEGEPAGDSLPPGGPRSCGASRK